MNYSTIYYSFDWYDGVRIRRSIQKRKKMDLSPPSPQTSQTLVVFLLLGRFLLQSLPARRLIPSVAIPSVVIPLEPRILLPATQIPLLRGKRPALLAVSCLFFPLSTLDSIVTHLPPLILLAAQLLKHLDPLLRPKLPRRVAAM